MTNKAPYRNCYIRPTAKNSESDQELAIKASGSMTGKGAKTVTETGKNGVTPKLDALLKTCLEGEHFVVAEVQCLGDDLPSVMKALAKIQKRGLVLVEAATGRQFRDCYDGPAAGLAADDYFKRRALSTMAAKRAGKKGGQARWEGADAGKVPLKDAVRRWNRAVDASATKDEAMMAVNEGYAEVRSYDSFMRLAREGKLPGAIKRLPSGARRKS